MAASPPNTEVQLSHAMVIRTNGVTIGALNEWNPKINRTLTDLYEFGQVTGPHADGAGEPFAVAPGNISGMSVDVRRWDLYEGQLETAFDTPDTTMLSNQIDEFGMREIWQVPAGYQGYYRLYAGCWWQDMGRTIDAKGDRTINAGGTIRYTRRDKFALSV